MQGSQQSQLNRVDANDNTTLPSGGWSDEDSPTRPKKRIKIEKGNDSYEFEEDPRQWTDRHHYAANISGAGVMAGHSVLALTPPQGDDHTEALSDVDVRGPGGFTPLMLASFRGGGLDIGLEDDSCASGSADGGELDDGSEAVITDLLAQGAAINAQTDRTGETPLHLAARYARADAAKRLLDAEAGPNAQDNTGRTPLHAAVAADAQGVFQVS